MTAQTPMLERGPVAASGAATVTLLAPAGRLSLRARETALPALSKVLGADLPRRIGVRANAGTTDVLCLGPDEWHILADPADMPRLIEGFAQVYAQVPHSLTDITDREISVRIEGPKAGELLTLGCPRDIDRIGEGEGRRTLMDGAAVILWRDGANSFRLDMWRSFAPHVIALLKTGCAELVSE